MISFVNSIFQGLGHGNFSCILFVVEKNDFQNVGEPDDAQSDAKRDQQVKVYDMEIAVALTNYHIPNRVV